MEVLVHNKSINTITRGLSPLKGRLMQTPTINKQPGTSKFKAKIGYKFLGLFNSEEEAQIAIDKNLKKTGQYKEPEIEVKPKKKKKIQKSKELDEILETLEIQEIEKEV